MICCRAGMRLEGRDDAVEGADKGGITLDGLFVFLGLGPPGMSDESA